MMGFDTEGLFEKEAFTSLTAGQVALFRQFAKDIEGKSALEVAALYRALNKQAAVTAAERAAIIKAIQEGLPHGEKMKFNGILKMLG